MFRKLKVKTLLNLGFLATVGLLILAGIFAYFTLTQVRYSLDRTGEEFSRMHAIMHLQVALGQTVMPPHDYLIPGGESDEKENFKKQTSHAEKLFKESELLNIESEEGKKALKHAQEEYLELKRIGGEIFALPNPRGNEKAGQLMEEMDLLAHHAIEHIDQLHAEVSQKINEAKKEAEDIQTKMGITFAASLLLIILTGGIYTFFLARSISEPITDLAKVAQKIGEGDLSQRAKAKSENEIGFLVKSFNQMAGGLQKAEHKLKKERNRLEQILESLPDSVAIVDRDLRVEYANKAARKGYRGKEWRGRFCHEVLFDQNIPCQPCKIAEVIKEEKNASFEVQHKDEKVFWETLTPIRNPGGSPAVLAIARDITERKRAEEMKSDLISVVSHELRTPMTAIKGNISMILEGDLGKVDEEVQELLTDVYTGNNQLITLVGDMLNISRLEAKKIPFDMSFFHLEEVILEVFHTLTPLADEQRLTLEYQRPYPVLPQVFADAEKVKEVLNNLIGNAIKFTPQGGVTVKNRLDKEAVITDVIDTGIGIPQDEQGKLFQKFSRLSSGFTEHRGGTGLGLFISKTLAEKMGGKIWVKSEAGKGSTFSFSLNTLGSGERRLKGLMGGERDKFAIPHSKRG